VNPFCPEGEPFQVAYGLGVDSTAMLVGLHQLGLRPDVILWADTGDEKRRTYEYLPIINTWLRSVGFPEVTVVKNARPKSGDVSLSAACLRTAVLPALAYGMHQCSIVWKQVPQQKWIKAWARAQEAWAAGLEVVTAIGYDASPRDGARRYKAEGKASPGFRNVFPLIVWGWDRERCEAEIIAAGLPLPVKSACFHCPASKKHEIDELARTEPDLAARAVEMERRAKARGLKTVKGLGRNFAWSEHLNMLVPRRQADLFREA
jgi:hypothetical protein